MDTKHWQLIRVTRDCEKVKKQYDTAREARLVSELAEAFRRRQYSGVHRISRQLAANCHGPKKRYYNVATRVRWSCEK